MAVDPSPDGPAALSVSPAVWTVHVDDNFHHGDEDERYSLGTFASYDAALAVCKTIVDDCLQVGSAKTADDLYASYATYGDDPWIEGPLPATESARFSAWDYARQRCDEILP